MWELALTSESKEENYSRLLIQVNKGAFSFKTFSSHAGLKIEFKLIDWALYLKSFTLNFILVSSEPKSIHAFDFLLVSMTSLLVLFCVQTVLASKRFENNSLIIPRRFHIPGFISSFKWFGSPLYLVSQNLFSVVSLRVSTCSLEFELSHESGEYGATSSPHVSAPPQRVEKNNLRLWLSFKSELVELVRSSHWQLEVDRPGRSIDLPRGRSTYSKTQLHTLYFLEVLLSSRA